MSKEAMKLALEAAYLAGWNASGEGYNSEYPFGDHARNPEEDSAWIKDRDNALRKALAEQPAQQQEPVAYASAWFALVMNAAAELEDASNCLRDEDAKRVAISGAKYYRDAAKNLYTSPQEQRKPLTDEQLRKVHHEDQFGLFCDYDEFEQITRAIEAAHGIKEQQ